MRWLITFAVLLLVQLMGGSARAEAGDFDALMAAAQAAYATRAYREADETYARAATTAREQEAPAQEARALLGRCKCLDAIDDLFGFREVTEQLLEVQRKLGESQAAWRTEADLGAVFGELGNRERSLYHLGRAISAFEETGDQESLARALELSASTAVGAGDALRGLADADRCVTLGRAALAAAGDDAGATASANLGLLHALRVRSSVYLLLRDAEAAIADLTEAIERIGPSGAGWQTRADLMVSLAVARGLRADPEAVDAARTIVLQCLDLYERNGDFTGAAPALMALASLDKERGKFGDAERNFQRARTQATPGSAIALNSWLGAADARFQAGRLDESRALYGQALAEAEKLGHRRLLERATSGTAEVALAQGDLVEALRLARLSTGYLGALDEGLDDEHLLDSDIYRSEVTAIGVQVGLEKKRADYVVEFIEQGRVAGLLATLGAREALRRVELSPEQYREYWRASEHYASTRLSVEAARSAGVRAEVLAATEQSDEARAQYQRVVAETERTLKEGSRVRNSVAATLTQLQGALETRDALVLYELLPDRAIAVVITKKNARIVELGARAPIEELCRAAGPTADSDPALDLARLDDLRKRVLDPLELGKGLGTLLVSPDGVLGLIPFAACMPCMVFPPERFAVVPSGSVYRILGQDRGLRGKRILALGDPQYTVAQVEVQKVLTRGANYLLPLPSSRLEVEAITTEADERLLGERATEEQVLELLAVGERWRVVHFACHGLIDMKNPRFSSLAITPGPRSDGFLTPIEIMNYRIPADLAVLSACSTGTGPALEGEGLLGFTRAFMLAGCSRVLVSLWNVDDKATRAFMEAFHATWKLPDDEGGGDASRAVQAAQEFVRNHEKWRNPYYWAAWSLWGLP